MKLTVTNDKRETQFEHAKRPQIDLKRKCLKG